ncbi:MAG: NYN domain-containing protein [Clostridiales bacterium]|jgi:predicted RNA-binding protein with PIN domain|nr:NYN domain-containing protein [Clostridiales bacterium]
MGEEYLLVDGYNIIFAWDKLAKIAEDISLEASRDKLTAIMSNYAGLKKVSVIVVFDAHMVKGGFEKIEKRANISVVYTKEAETADNFIERTAGYLAKYSKVSVATSDNLEQIIIIGKGAVRVTAKSLIEMIDTANAEMRKLYTEKIPIKKNMLYDHLDEKTAAMLEKMRRGRF